MTTRRGSGEASIIHRADGRWEGRIDLGFVDGKRRRKSVYARTRREVVDKIRAAQRALDAGALAADDRMTVKTWLDRWVNTTLANRYANGTIAQSTVASYAETVRLHLSPALGRHRLTKLTPAHVDAFVTTKLSKLSPNSVRIMRTVLRKALFDAQKSGLVHTNVVTLSEPVRVSRRAKHWLEIDQARKLLKTVANDRLGALYVLLLSCGLRRGEALGLHWEDVDLDGGTILIRYSLQRLRVTPLPDGTYPGGKRTTLVFGSPKTEGSWRTQSLPEPVVTALRRHKVRQVEERLAASSWERDDVVFTTPLGQPIDPDNLAKTFSSLCQKAGLGHRNLHQLRHSAATILLAQGIPLHEVSEVLGHSSISITKDVYGHLAAERKRAAADAIGDALWGGAS